MAFLVAVQRNCHLKFAEKLASFAALMSCSCFLIFSTFKDWMISYPPPNFTCPFSLSNKTFSIQKKVVAYISSFAIQSKYRYTVYMFYVMMRREKHPFILNNFYYYWLTNSHIWFLLIGALCDWDVLGSSQRLFIGKQEKNFEVRYT